MNLIVRFCIGFVVGWIVADYIRKVTWKDAHKKLPNIHHPVLVFMKYLDWGCEYGVAFRNSFTEWTVEEGYTVMYWRELPPVPRRKCKSIKGIHCKTCGSAGEEKNNE